MLLTTKKRPHPPYLGAQLRRLVAQLAQGLLTSARLVENGEHHRPHLGSGEGAQRARLPLRRNVLQAGACNPLASVSQRAPCSLGARPPSHPHSPSPPRFPRPFRFPRPGSIPDRQQLVDHHKPVPLATVLGGGLQLCASMPPPPTPHHRPHHPTPRTQPPTRCRSVGSVCA